MEELININQLDLIKHAIGFNRKKVKYNKYIAWRNYFCSYEISADWEHLIKLELAVKNKADKDSGAIYYFVTTKGMELLGKILEIKIVEDKD